MKTTIFTEVNVRFKLGLHWQGVPISDQFQHFDGIGISNTSTLLACYVYYSSNGSCLVRQQVTIVYFMHQYHVRKLEIIDGNGVVLISMLHGI